MAKQNDKPKNQSAEVNPNQKMADELMIQLGVDKLWLLENGMWYTTEAKAKERAAGGTVEPFVKSKK